MCNFEVLMRNLSGPEDVLGAFQLMLLAVANTKTQDLKPNDVLDVAFIIAMLLASLNSCCNPWIYMFFAGHLFHDLMRCFVCCSSQYLKASRCGGFDHQQSRRSISTYVVKDHSSQRSVTHTSST